MAEAQHGDTLIVERVSTPIGWLMLAADQVGLRHIEFCDNRHPADRQHWRERDATTSATTGACLDASRTQLLEYFERRRVAFDLPLAPRGTPFQCQVWRVLATIPYGTTWSYRSLAEAIGKPAAVRAVGAANGRNPLPIVLPCHRVIGADGSLVGFGGGLAIKAALLRLEGADVGAPTTGDLFG
jgi:methylated-DNA-[protein]-cysteine S-methyltransferase